MDLYAKIKKYISEINEIPEDEWPYLLSSVQIRTLEKGEYLFRQGDDSQYMGMVLSGLVHNFYTTLDNKQISKQFAWEGRLVSPYVSIISKTNSTFSSQAMEKTVVVGTDSKKMDELMARHTCWERLRRKASEMALVGREKREYESLVYSNLERYEMFREEFAPIMDRIPQYMIASYLGITSVALSRLLSQKKGTKEES